jgi:hypothetical protein
MRLQLAILLSLSLASIISVPDATAQQSEHPNMKHFYRSPLQIDVVPEDPIVKYHGQPGGASGGMQGSLPNRQMGLPQAGWNSYAPVSPPGLSTSLPKANNGVPPKATPKAVGLKGKRGSMLSGRNKTQGPKDDPNVAKAYKPYSSYTNPDTPSLSGASQNSTSTKVHGNVVNQPQAVPNSALHWSRGH